MLGGSFASILAAGTFCPSIAAAGERETNSDIVATARRVLAQNAAQIAKTDVVGVVNYSAPSARSRFHLVDMVSARVSSLLVSHGRGSDPQHTGYLQHFSNDIGSKASSCGAYSTGAHYVGKHGRSMRLAGLDPENSNAMARAIVVHGAWYVGDEMLNKYGKLGRSEGCFALSEADLDEVLERLGPGRLLFAGKF